MTKKPTKQRQAKKASGLGATLADGATSIGARPDGYAAWLKDLKARIRTAQVRASVSVNRELVSLYWQIGRDILERQQREGWGTKVIDRIARDLLVAFPDIKGFSARNLKYMRSFAEAWPDAEFVQQLAAQLPWFHLCTLLDKLATPVERNWYLTKTIENGWSRNILVMQIETGAMKRVGRATTNFAMRLPKPQSDLVQESLKDPYRFDFLGLAEDAQERDLEAALTTHITRFLLELGAGFAFVGRQVNLKVGGEDFFLDLLFYHLKLRCYVVIELKTGAFKPEHAGKLNFYLSAVDSLVKGDHDNPTVGLLLCKTKNRIIAEYALRDVSKPMGVAEYQLVGALPPLLEAELPSVEQIERELRASEGDTASSAKRPRRRTARKS
jgi:predicted nuclease of restriction endonuclease-like (RecB) superfamily